MNNGLLIINNSRGQYHDGTKLNLKTINKIFGNIDYNVFNNFKNIQSSMLLLGQSCSKYINTYKHSIFFGGDHLSSYGTILGSLIKFGNNFKLLWIDAHTDIHSFETSPSKNLHGMVVNFLLNHNYENIPRLKPNQILYIGIRSVEKEEYNFINQWNISYISMKDIIENYYQSLNEINKFVKDSNIHISLDVDVFDPSIMPSTGTVEPHGLFIEQFNDIISIVRQYSKKYYATDIMEFNRKIGNQKEVSISINTIQHILNIVL
jgi:arginase